MHGYRRLLLFIGASIALSIFVVKDEIRQDLKDLTDSINTAENVFMVRSDSREVIIQVARIQQLLEGKPSWTGLASSEAYYRSLTAQLDSTLHLLAKVPHGGEFDREAIDLMAKRNQWMADSLRPMAPISEGPVVRDEAEEKAEKALGQKLWNDAFLLDGQVQSFGSSVVDMARKVEAHEEHLYRISKYASYTLYSLGWLVGLIGTLFGGEDMRVPE